MMIGKSVEFPIERGVYIPGTITDFCEQTGRVTVIDSDGIKWVGFEYQIELID